MLEEDCRRIMSRSIGESRDRLNKIVKEETGKELSPEAWSELGAILSVGICQSLTDDYRCQPKP